MPPLRQRMSADLPRSGLADRTQERDVRAVRQLAEPYHKAPERLTEEERPQDFLALQHGTHDSRRARPSPGARPAARWRACG